MTHKTLCLTLPFVLLTPLACKPDEPPPTPYQPGTTGMAGAPPVVTPAPTTSAAGTPAPAPTPSTPVPTDPALIAAVTPMLTQLAASQTVAGSKPLGAAVV